MPRHLPRPLADEKELNRMLKTISKKDDLLGHLASWGLHNIRISPSNLAALMEKHGIEKWTPVPIRKKTAVRKALTEIRRQLETGQISVLVRRVQETDEEVRYAIVHESKDLTRVDLNYATFNQVVFDKESGELSFTKGKVRAIEEAYELLCGVYTEKELLLMVKSIVTGYGAINLRDGTGMYFLPAAMRKITEALVELFETDLKPYMREGGRAYFRPFGISGSEKRTREQVANIATVDISEELTEAELYLKRVTEELDSKNGDARVRASSRSGAINAYRNARGKAMMMQQLLQMQLGDIDKRLEESDVLAQKLLIG